jgi:hypothetical protein
MKLYVTAATLSLLLSIGSGQTATTQPAKKPAKAAPKIQVAAPTVDPATKKILDAMEAAGKKTDSIQAELTYNANNTKLGDSEYRTGWVAYKAGKSVKINIAKTIEISPMFRVHFETHKLGRGKTTKRPVDYAYDGKTLTVARTKTKTITRFQMPGGNNGADMLKLGKGPMPLPFGQKTADMIKYFVCTTRPPTAKDIADNTAYIYLVPRKQHAKNLNTVYIHMWISTKTNLPVKIITKDKSKNIITTSFNKVVINKPVKPSLFSMPKPRGWKLIVQPLKPGQDIKP